MTTLSRPRRRGPAAGLLALTLTCMGFGIPALAQEAATPDPADFIHTWENGCGSGWTEAVVPDFDLPVSISGLITKALNPQNFTSACYGHDRCWGTLGADRWACDQQFLSDLSAACTATYLPSSNWRDWWKVILALDPGYSGQLAACYSQASIYMGAVEAAGAWGASYDTAQQQAYDYQQCSRGQFVASGMTFPRDVIDRALVAGCRVGNIETGEGWWVLPFRTTVGDLPWSQQIHTSVDLAQMTELATRLAGQGLDLVSIAYADQGWQGWLGVFNQNTGSGSTVGILSSSTLQGVLNLALENYPNDVVTQIEYGGGTWVALVSEFPVPVRWQALWDEDLASLNARLGPLAAGTGEQPGVWLPVDLEYGDGAWVALAHDLPAGAGAVTWQMLFSTDSLHDARVAIDEGWLAGRQLWDLEFGNGAWAFLLGPGTGGSQNPPDEPTLGTGDVQVTLRWDAPVDLDLYVQDPSGYEVGYNTGISPSGGELDVDANAACRSIVADPVENVFWAPGEAPRGPYQARVVVYSWCGWTGPVNYELSYELNQSGFVVYQQGAIQPGSDAPNEGPLEFDY